MLHPRYFLAKEMGRKAESAFWDALDKEPEKALTYLEICGILSHMMQQAVMYGIRLERHPDNPNKRGDEA